MKLSYWFLLCPLNKGENLVWELDCIKITGISKTWHLSKTQQNLQQELLSLLGQLLLISGCFFSQSLLCISPGASQIYLISASELLLFKPLSPTLTHSLYTSGYPAMNKPTFFPVDSYQNGLRILKSEDAPELGPSAVLQGTGHIDLRPDCWSHRNCYTRSKWEWKVGKLSECPVWGNVLNHQGDSLKQLIFIDRILCYRNCSRYWECGHKQEEKLSALLAVKTVSQHGMSEMKHSKDVLMWNKGWPPEGYQSLNGDHLFHCVAVLGDWLHTGKLIRIRFKNFKKNRYLLSDYITRKLST